MDRSKEDPSQRAIIHGSDFLNLDTAEAPPGGLADWLTDRLRDAIAEGRLPVGGRLPATRVLAADLGISRGIVTEAYRRLAEDGHIAGHRRAGTVVVAVPIRAPAPAATATAASGRDVFSGRLGAAVFDALRGLPARIDLSPGVPDLAAFPRAAWLRAERSVLGTLSASDFGYGDPRGTPALREAVAQWLARNRGIAVVPDDVIIVHGTAQALALCSRVLASHGITTVAVEEPGSLGVRQHLNDGGMATPAIPVDKEGIDVAALKASGAPAVLLTPAHQFPTGVVLSGPRRRALLSWAEYGGLVIEDDYDAEHRYDRPPAPALRALLADQVLYTGSVSKLLAPAIRIGWALVPRRYRDDFVAAKRYADLGNAVLPQLVLAELMRSGALERHLRMLRRRHQARRDAMIEAIRERLPEATVHGAAAGLHLMLTLPDGRSDVDVAVAALQRGVKIQPLSWHRQRPGPRGFVLGYAAVGASDIAAGIRTLSDVLKETR